MKYILFGIILLFTFGCDDYPSSGPVNPTFDPPVVNEMLITLENAQAAGILRFGPVLVPIVEPFSEGNTGVYPSIATDQISLYFTNEEITDVLIFVVRANLHESFGNQLYVGGNIGRSNAENTFVFEQSTLVGGHFTFRLDLKGLPESVYVVYLKDNATGLIIGEAAFFKTNEANKQRIYKNLNLGVSK